MRALIGTLTLLCLGATSIVAAQTAVKAKTGDTLMVTSPSMVSLRQGPSIEDAVVVSLRSGDELQVLNVKETAGVWYMVWVQQITVAANVNKVGYVYGGPWVTNVTATPAPDPTSTSPQLSAEAGGATVTSSLGFVIVGGLPSDHAAVRVRIGPVRTAKQQVPAAPMIAVDTKNSQLTGKTEQVCVTTTGFVMAVGQAILTVTVLSDDGKSAAEEFWIPVDSKAKITTDKIDGDHVCVPFGVALNSGQKIVVAALPGAMAAPTATSAPTAIGDTSQTPSSSSTPATHLSTADTRMVAGMEQAALASSPASWHKMVDFMLTAPLAGKAGVTSQKRCDPCGRSQKPSIRQYPNIIAWADVRLNGVSQQGAPTVNELASGVTGGVVAPDSNEFVDGIAFSGGLEFKIRDGLRFFSDGEHYQFEPTVIAAFGGETPVDPLSPPAIFKISQQVIDRYGITAQSCPMAASGCSYVAFEEPDRTRFFRQWAVGLRLKTHHFDCPNQKIPCALGDRKEANFPGLLDITLGQDEAVTGGVFGRPVLKLAGFFPLPIEGGAKAIYIFGGMNFAIQKNGSTDPLLLSAPGATVMVPGPDVFVHVLTSGEMNRDSWKIGIGVDLLGLIKGASTSTSSATTPAGGSK